MPLFSYRGVHDRRARKRFIGLWSPDGWRNLCRPNGYRWEAMCTRCNPPCGRPAIARGYCRQTYDAVYRRRVLGMAPRLRKSKITADARRWAKHVGLIMELRDELTKTYVTIRDGRIRAAGRGKRWRQAIWLIAGQELAHESLLVL